VGRGSDGCRTGQYNASLSMPTSCSSFNQCIKLNTTWGKGYVRKGAALHGARRYDEAISAYEEGLKHEDSPALRKGLEDVRSAKGK